MGSAENTLNDKVKDDTEDRINSFEEERRADRMRGAERKVNSEITKAQKSARKDLSNSQLSSAPATYLDYGGNQKMVFILGITLALVNDFFDLIFWNNPLLLGQVFDLTALFLLMLLLIFFSKSYPLTVFLIFIVFILEIVPVLGVLPFWTIGLGLWYWSNKNG